jgi:hypothetical protein
MKLRLPQTRRFRIYIYLLCTLLVLLAVDLIWVRLWRHITLSPQTTVITSPLKPDGTPDYLQYLNDRAKKGVTLENNAFIPFLEIATPVRGGGGANSSILTPTFAELGVTPPATAHQVMTFAQWLQSRTPPVAYDPSRMQEEDFVRARPWAPADHPDVVAWLNANERVFRWMPEVTARSRWYMPLTRPDSDLMIAVLLSPLDQVRPTALVISTRAMLEIHESQFAQARADILMMHRLARLPVQGNSLIEYLVGMAVDSMALDADRALVSAPGLPRDELRQVIAQYDALPLWPPPTDALDRERFRTLDAVMFASRHIDQIPLIERPDAPNIDSDLFPWFTWLNRHLHPAHFNAALRDVNQLQDRFVQATRAPTATEREDLMHQASQGMDAFLRPHEGRWGDPAYHLVACVMPSLGKVVVLANVHDMNAKLTRVALALAAYKADKGAFPDQLPALAPTYIPALPIDEFSGGPLKYRKTPDGCLAYSVGINRQDDGGVPSPVGVSSGDLVVQFPLPEKK